MGATIELSYFNTFTVKRLASEAMPQISSSAAYAVDPSATVPVGLRIESDWYIEESRIRGGYNNTTVDFGVKAYIVEDTAAQSRRASSLIYSGVFNSRTGINQTNQFSVAEEITRSVDPINGSIQKLYCEDTNLIIFQERKVNRALIDKDAIYSAEGASITTTANLVIGQIIAYRGEYGISRNPESFAVYGTRKYFADADRNAVLRLSNDGITEISNYGMSDFFRDQLRLVQRNTGTGKVIGGFDIYNQNYVISLQPESLPYRTLSFDERVLGWTSFFTFDPYFIFSVQGDFYSIRNDKLFLHYQNPAQPNKFYAGGSRLSTLKLVVNPEPTRMKTFNTINYEGTNGWEVINLASESTGQNFFDGGWSSYQDTASGILSYNDGGYEDGGIQYYEGFDRKQNKYVASIKNNTPPQIGEVLFGDSLMGTKGYYIDVTMRTDGNTNTTSIKRIFSVGATYNLR